MVDQTMNYYFTIRKIQNEDKAWIVNFVSEYWLSPTLITRRKKYSVEFLDGFVAIQNSDYFGLVTLSIENSSCQIVTLNAKVENVGIGTGLLNQSIEYAMENKCKRIWLVTTNDNTPALRYYQTRGFKLKALYCNEIERTRKLKPNLPLYGINSIPIRDEIELEYIL